jgi:hypothetical protein
MKVTTPSFAQRQSLRRSKRAIRRFAGNRSIGLRVSVFAGVERLHEVRCFASHERSLI